LVLENIIRDLLREGINPSISEITSRYETFIADNDTSQPLFGLADAKVVKAEASSATKYNNTNDEVLQDLVVLYRHLFKVSNQSIENFERWKTETKILEGRLDDLNERINGLLLISSDTAGYFNFVQDSFVDNSKVDLANTTAYVNVDKGLVTIGTTNAGATRIDLSGLRNEDVEFVVLSRNGLVSSVTANNSQRRYAIQDLTNYYQEYVYFNKPQAVSVELKVDFLEEKEVSRVDVDLHMSNQNSAVEIIPFYSTNNYDWKQLPVSTPTRSVIDKTSFQFSPVVARYVKFVMTKLGFDQVVNSQYVYEFGVDEISFYNEGFDATAGTLSALVSKPLSVLGTDKQPEEFTPCCIRSL